ncbi:MAG: hypothetical protein ACE361_00930 [Aureliella sp.]
MPIISFEVENVGELQLKVNAFLATQPKTTAKKSTAKKSTAKKADKPEPEPEPVSIAELATKYAAKHDTAALVAVIERVAGCKLLKDVPPTKEEALREALTIAG